MKPRPASDAPAGNIRVLQPFVFLKHQHLSFSAWLKKRNFGARHFVVSATLLMVAVLALHSYAGNYVYAVFLNGEKAGTVKSAKEVDAFVSDLTAQCADLYGMALEPGCKIELVKEFDPGKKDNPGLVEANIRQNITFETEAYLLTVNGEPLAYLKEEEDLQTIVGRLKSIYGHLGGGSRLLSLNVTDELALVPSLVRPGDIFKPEDVVEMVTEGSNNSSPMPASFAKSDPARLSLGSRKLYTSSNAASDSTNLTFLSPSEMITREDPYLNNSNNIHVETVEEMVVSEQIPFETEIEYEEEMWIVQKEVATEGEPGEREIVYHVTKENGLEKTREKISERVIQEPVSQVELHGTAKVPSMGSGQFIWPVEGGGEVTPGRGFSNFHTGIDIHTATGTDILAADSGVVWFAGRGGSQGNYLIVYHGSFWTLYLHNTENLVTEGTAVEQGDVIAKAGSTGRSTGPHLHFEVRLDDGSGEWHTYYQHKPIDPLQFFRP